MHVTRLPNLLPVRQAVLPCSSGAGFDFRRRLSCSRKKVQKDLVEAEATLERFTW